VKNYNELVEFMNTDKFGLRVMSLVEAVAGDNFKSLRRLEPTIKTLNDYVGHVEPDVAQQTVFLTVRFAYEFEYAIKRVLQDAGFTTVSKLHNSKEEKNDFGVRASDRSDIIYFEVKTTQAKNSWTGATHSEAGGKVDSYVLVNYELDRNMQLPCLTEDTSALHGVFKSVHFSVVNGMTLGWTGEATTASSFTQAKIGVDQASAYNKQVCLGEAIVSKQAKKWCKIVRQDLSEFRNHANVLVTP